MKKIALLLTLMVVAACQSRTQSTVPDIAAQQEIARLDSLVQALQKENAAQEERIKDLEGDLEDVMGFLNERGY